MKVTCIIQISFAFLFIYLICTDIHFFQILCKDGLCASHDQLQHIWIQVRMRFNSYSVKEGFFFFFITQNTCGFWRLGLLCNSHVDAFFIVIFWSLMVWVAGFFTIQKRAAQILYKTCLHGFGKSYGWVNFFFHFIPDSRWKQERKHL